MQKNNERVRDRNFEWDLDLTGVSLSASAAAEGFHKVEIIDIYVDRAYNESRCEFEFKVLDGPEKGRMCYGNMLRPGSYEGNDNSYYWVKFFLSIGIPADKVTENIIKFNPAGFVGQIAYIFFRPRNKEAGTYSKLDFHSKSDWTALKTKTESAQNSALSAATHNVKPPSILPSRNPPLPSIPASPAMSAPTPKAGFASEGASGSDILAYLNTPQAK